MQLKGDEMSLLQIITDMNSSGMLAILYRHGVLSDNVKRDYGFYIEWKKQVDAGTDRMVAYNNIAEDNGLEIKTVMRAVKKFRTN
jgi:hypothetical protein